MNNGMPPRSRNHRLPAACDAPTAIAASSLVSPLATSRQNRRSTSRRSDGAPGDFIADLPVNAFIHPAGLPTATPKLEVLRPPVESTQYTSRAFATACHTAGVRQSMSAVGSSADNAAAESFNASLKRETLQGRRAFTDEHEARLTTFRWLHRYNTVRRHSRLGHQSPITYENSTTASTILALAA
jgi:hypothetical protein